MVTDPVVIYTAPALGARSVDEQRERLHSLGGPVVAELGDDEPPADAVRPGLLAALDVLRTGAARYVLVDTPDVIHPDVVEQEAYAAEVRDAGGRLYVADRGRLADPLRDTLRRYDAARRRWAGARLTSGRTRWQQRAGWSGGRPPYGAAISAGSLVDHAQEMTVVNRIRGLRASGCTYQEIADILTAEGYPTKEGAATWHREQVRRVLMRHGHQAPDEP